MWTQEEFEHWKNKADNAPKETLEDALKAVPLHGKEIEEANIIEVSVGTTGYKGGDTGHGGRTVFRLRNKSCTDMRLSIGGSELRDVEDVAIVFGGDCELSTFKKALHFALLTLEEQAPEMSLWERIKYAWKYRSFSWLKV